MASLSSTITHNDSPFLLILKGLSAGIPIFIAGSMFTVSSQLLPSLILATKQGDNNGPKYSPMESGRLTPQPTLERKEMNPPPTAAIDGSRGEGALSGSSGYRLAAMQFSLMSKTAFAAQVPPELLTIIASSFLAYHYRASSLPASIWGKWAAVAGLVAAGLQFSGALMVPLDHKIARVAGVEPQIEPYEDAPPDREMERANTENFFARWGALNTVRVALVAVAGAIGIWGLLE